MHIHWDIVNKYYIQLFDKYSEMFLKIIMHKNNLMYSFNKIRQPT